MKGRHRILVASTNPGKLAEGYDNEQAKDVILYNCSLSALVMQERLDNGYYLKMKADDDIAPDLLGLYCEAFIKMLLNKD